VSSIGLYQVYGLIISLYFIKMLGMKKPLGRAMIGHKMPLSMSRLGSKLTPMVRGAMKPANEVVKNVSSGLERRILKR
jgi:hypothetical protein